jgi:hypothetical protein
MGQLHEHAVRELSRLDNDEDFNEHVLNVIDAFASYGHSGCSAQYTIPLIHQLLQFKPLTDITSAPDEWMEVAELLWQNKRRSSTFSRDGGITWYDIEDAALNNGDVWFK